MTKTLNQKAKLAHYQQKVLPNILPDLFPWWLKEMMRTTQYGEIELKKKNVERDQVWTPILKAQNFIW